TWTRCWPAPTCAPASTRIHRSRSTCATTATRRACATRSGSACRAYPCCCCTATSVAANCWSRSTAGATFSDAPVSSGVLRRWLQRIQQLDHLGTNVGIGRFPVIRSLLVPYRRPHEQFAGSGLEYRDHGPVTDRRRKGLAGLLVRRRRIARRHRGAVVDGHPVRQGDLRGARRGGGERRITGVHVVDGHVVIASPGENRVADVDAIDAVAGACHVKREARGVVCGEQLQRLQLSLLGATCRRAGASATVERNRRNHDQAIQPFLHHSPPSLPSVTVGTRTGLVAGAQIAWRENSASGPSAFAPHFCFTGRRQPSNVCCRARARVSWPSGASRVITEPAPRVACAPMLTGATRAQLEPMKAPSPMRVTNLFTPS